MRALLRERVEVLVGPLELLEALSLQQAQERELLRAVPIEQWEADSGLLHFQTVSDKPLEEHVFVQYFLQ